MRLLPYACLCFLFFSCSSRTSDRQAKNVVLPSITIGEQTWMSENLAVTHFANGDPIPHVTDTLEWEKAGQEGRPAWSYFHNEEANGKAWGVLYNFHAVASEKGLAPQGWHLPTLAEFDILTTTLGGKNVAAFPMKAFDSWNARGVENPAEPSGFDALPAKGRFDDGGFIDLLDVTYWWTSEGSAQGKSAYYLAISGDGVASTSSLHKGYGFSVRLIKD